MWNWQRPMIWRVSLKQPRYLNATPDTLVAIYCNYIYKWGSPAPFFLPCFSSPTIDLVECAEYGCVPFGWSRSGSVIQDLSVSGCIKGTGESMTRVESAVSLMHMIQTDLGSLIRIQITQKERSLKNDQGRHTDWGMITSRLGYSTIFLTQQKRKWT